MLVGAKRIVLRRGLRMINVGGTTGIPSRPISGREILFSEY